MASQQPYEAVLERLGDGVYDCWDETEGFRPQRLDQPRELVLLWAAGDYLTLVGDSGFHQYLGHIAGFTAPEAVEGFNLIGLWDCGNVVKRAMAFFGDPYPRSASIRHAKISAYGRNHSSSPPSDWDPFFDLNDEFFARADHDRCDRATNRLVERFL